MGKWRAGAEKERVFAVKQIFQLIPQKEPVNARRRRNTIGYAKLNQNTISYTKTPSQHPLRGGHPSDTATVFELEGQANQSEGTNVGENPQRP